MAPLTDALRAAAEAMANELDLLAQDASDASGDATDGAYLRDLANRWRVELLFAERDAERQAKRGATPC